MNKYTTLYFDLDNTLLDFLKAEYNAIKELLRLNNLPNDDEKIRHYSKINQMYWERFERGEIEKSGIYVERFVTFVAELGFDADAQKLSDGYFELLPKQHDIMPDAPEILKWVKGKGYTVCITTNGVSSTQYQRIADCGLNMYFDYVFVSEDAGHQKPEREYFEYVAQNSPEKDFSRVLVIGDSQSSDILGGINAGIDTCWFNPSGNQGKYNPTYEIKSLLELKNIL